MRAKTCLVIAGVVLSLAACRSETKFPSQKFGLRWTNHAHGVQHSTQREHVALPFELAPEGTSGTAILLAYLRTLEQQGVRFVSDVSLAIQLRHNGVPIECVSQILVEDGAALPPPPAGAPADPAPADPAAEPEYATTVRPWQPGQHNAWVSDLDLICKQEGVLVTDYAGKYPERTAAETARLWAPAENRGAGALPSQIIPVSRIEWEDRCQLLTVRRQVVRYDHFVAARFAPPDLARIGREYSDWRLVEAPPMCHPIEVPKGARLQQRIEAEVYYTGSLGRRRLPAVFSL